MNLSSLLFFAAATMGLSHIVVSSSISTSVKDWCRDNIKESIRTSWLGQKVAKATNCFQCFGFWSGLFVGSILFPGFWTVLLCGFAGSWLSFWGAGYMAYLEAQTIINLDVGESHNT